MKSSLTRPLGVALSAVRRARVFCDTDLQAQAPDAEKEHLTSALAAVSRACKAHCRRLALDERHFERLLRDGDIELPVEELFRLLLDVTGALRELMRGEPERVHVQAPALVRTAVRLARDWAQLEGIPRADLDPRLASEDFFNRE